MQNTVIQISNDGMGRGDPALQHKLIAKYAQVKADKVITL